jgi:hypothetical protein
MRRRLMMLIAALPIVALAPAAQGQAPPSGWPPGVDPRVAPHCLSMQPDRLALTPEQETRINEILRTMPEGRERRAAIIKVLTVTQRRLYDNYAGIAAC